MESRIFWARAVWPIALALQACGGSDSTTSITGQVVKGPVAGTQVCAHTLAAQSEMISCTTTDANGNYALDLPQSEGEVLLEATGGAYVDEATGLTTALIDPMRTVAGTAQAASMVLLTPFTELAVQKATPAGHRAPRNLAAFQAQVGVVESALGITGITAGRPFGGEAERDQMHKKALEAFSRQQSGKRASVAAVISDLSAVLDKCGAPAVGAQLAIHGAAGLPRSGPRVGGIVSGDSPDATHPSTSPIDVAASRLVVLGNGCLVPVDSGIGFAQISVRSATVAAQDAGSTVIPNWQNFSIDGSLTAQFYLPASNFGNLNISSGSSSQLQIPVGVLVASIQDGTLATQLNYPASNSGNLTMSGGSSSPPVIPGAVLATGSIVLMSGGAIALNAEGTLILTGTNSSPPPVLTLGP